MSFLDFIGYGILLKILKTVLCIAASIGLYFFIYWLLNGKRDNKEECNHDKQHDDDFNLRKYEYSGGTVKDFNDKCRKSFFDSIGLHEEEDEKDDE